MVSFYIDDTHTYIYIYIYIYNCFLGHVEGVTSKYVAEIRNAWKPATYILYIYLPLSLTHSVAQSVGAKEKILFSLSISIW